MIQHPIPQNVTGYQFRLIGDMTIKQFILLAIGICGAIFFYYTNLFSPIKWVFVLSSAAGGFALAFVPFEERPLDQWIVNYVRAIYKPTQFIWRKQSNAPDYFEFTPDKNTPLPQDLQEISNQANIRREQGLRSYLVTLPQEVSNQESWEQSYVDQITSLFGAANPTSLTTPDSTLNIDNFIPTATATPPNDDPIDDQTESTHHKPLVDSKVSSGVISLEKIQVEKASTPSSKTTTTPFNPLSATTDTQSSSITPAVIDSSTVVAAVTTPELPFPSTPTTPNTIVGMVLSPEGKIVDGAIIEVVDESGMPVRATKTNQLGQFFSTTPLKRGLYHLTIEKTGLAFDTIELNIVGSIVPPLKIQAKS